MTPIRQLNQRLATWNSGRAQTTIGVHTFQKSFSHRGHGGSAVHPGWLCAHWPMAEHIRPTIQLTFTPPVLTVSNQLITHWLKRLRWLCSNERHKMLSDPDGTLVSWISAKRRQIYRAVPDFHVGALLPSKMFANDCCLDSLLRARLIYCWKDPRATKLAQV